MSINTDVSVDNWDNPAGSGLIGRDSVRHFTDFRRFGTFETKNFPHLTCLQNDISLVTASFHDFYPPRGVDLIYLQILNLQWQKC
jgi:hypothetical protein